MRAFFCFVFAGPPSDTIRECTIPCYCVLMELSRHRNCSKENHTRGLRKGPTSGENTLLPTTFSRDLPGILGICGPITHSPSPPDAATDVRVLGRMARITNHYQEWAVHASETIHRPHPPTRPLRNLEKQAKCTKIHRRERPAVQHALR